MSLFCREVGHRQTLSKRWKNALASTAVAAALTMGVWMSQGTEALSGGETRTLSLHHVHTGEDLTITYKQNGKYIPSALKKINYLMRDWRRKEVITMDPKTIDLMWELHADLGSRKPIHIICGYRSSRTNAFLKRVGRNVARKSQHMVGKAIDLYFPDVPSVKIRNSALVRKVGGVGYYRSSGGPSGFVHIDSGRVRHWGPGISSSQMAKILRDYRRTVGARLSKADQRMIASADLGDSDTPSLYDRILKGGKSKSKTKAEAPVEADYSADDEDLADLAAGASQEPAKPKAKLLPQEPAEVVQQAAPVPLPEVVASAVAIPKPRPKPIEVLMMAAVNMKIEPASAPPPAQDARQRPVSDSIGVVIAAESMADASGAQPTSNAAAKGSLAGQLVDGTATGVPLIRTLAVSSAGSDLFWWPSQGIVNPEQAVRRDGAPQAFSTGDAGILPGFEAAAAEPPPSLPKLAVAAMPELASGKTDMQVVNREGKGSLMEDAPALKAQRQKLGMLESQ